MMVQIGAIAIVVVVVTAIAGWIHRSARDLRKIRLDNEVRADRLSVLERTNRRLQEAAECDVFQLSLQATLELGCEASSLLDRLEDNPVMTAGDWRCVAPSEAIEQSTSLYDADPMDVIVTTWLSNGTHQMYSVSSVEPTTSLVLVGWSRTPITDDLADAFATLTGFVSQAVSRQLVIDVRTTAADLDEVELIDL